MSKEEYEKTMSIHTVSEKLREAEEQIELGEVTDAKAPLSKLREKYGVNSDQYYCLLLDECACPAFCSSEKPYFGTQKDLRKIAIQMKNLGVYEDTVAASGEVQNPDIPLYQQDGPGGDGQGIPC